MVRRGLMIAASACAVLAVIVAAVAVRGFFLGETLAADDGWRVVARWSPFGSSITYEDDRGSGGVGGLTRPALLSEGTTFTAPDQAATYAVGTVPEGTDRIRVTAADGSTVLAELHRVVSDVFYVARLPGASRVTLVEAVDADGRAIARFDASGRPSEPAPAARPDGPSSPAPS